MRGKDKQWGKIFMIRSPKVENVRERKHLTKHLIKFVFDCKYIIDIANNIEGTCIFTNQVIGLSIAHIIL